MSSNEEPKLLAGHPPAVKAGGMRIARTHRSSTGDSKTEMTKEDIEEYGTGSPPKGNKDAVISGAVVKEKDAFPPEAVKRFHEASLPSKEQRPVERSHHIHQPR